jgi:hypothetical protein
MGSILSTKEIVERFRNTHGSKYDYSETVYVDSKTKVIIICKKHGDFEQSVNHHIKGSGCPKCSPNYKKRLTTSEFISKSKLIHKNDYQYHKSNYKNAHTKITITCPLHGDFKQLALNHLKGNGCAKCKSSISKPEIELQKFIIASGYSIEVNKRDIIAPYELDIFIPALNVAIEFNGLFWHYSDKHFRKGYHGMKSNLCREKGIGLFHVREELWIKDKERMKEIILKYLKSKVL